MIKKPTGMFIKICMIAENIMNNLKNFMITTDMNFFLVKLFGYI